MDNTIVISHIMLILKRERNPRDYYSEVGELKKLYANLGAKEKCEFWEFALTQIENHSDGWWSFLQVGLTFPSKYFSARLAELIEANKVKDNTMYYTILVVLNSSGEEEYAKYVESFLSNYPIGSASGLIYSLCYSSERLFLHYLYNYWKFLLSDPRFDLSENAESIMFPLFKCLLKKPLLLPKIFEVLQEKDPNLLKPIVSAVIQYSEVFEAEGKEMNNVLELRRVANGWL